MLKHQFGPTQTNVRVIGQGTWQINSKGAAALRLGIELGMTHIDTAELYTGAEQVVADVIRDNRRDIFLISKVVPSNASREGTIRACEASLKRLKTDYLDVYLLHWWSGTHPLEDTMGAMEKLVASGKIRHIGVSNFDIPQLKRAVKALSKAKIVCNQVLYHLRSRGIEHRLIDYCESQDIAVVGYSPFGQGDFPSAGSKQGRILEAISTKHGKTPRQVALNVLTRRKGLFSIPKSGNTAHVRENAGGTGWKLDAEDLASIDDVFPLPGKNESLDMI